jgi:hypothetical protein
MFHYSESTRELTLKLNNRVVVLGGDNCIQNNTVSISQTTTERKQSNYPSLFKYGFRVKALKS